ncbi:MAG: glycosyltransferase family 2 protein [Flavobacteriales bacterium]|jgi:O-antigen biosynthesis protein|nr:glycosyl transferase family 2 [Flavobacteriales bacterium]MDG1917329.1 glycosyltransferase family 2 protein [Flavobacteriales bacterium]|tara:strand:- start:1468 stop:2331 length:864 start_codon:yes stop_codon:yes gene_type:complete
MQLSVIIVNYNVKNLLRDCLLSVQKAALKLDTEIIVVDNASSDGSVKMLQEEFKGVKLIANSKNVGFSTANNQGIAQAKGQYILILNPDTLVYEQTFNDCMKFCSENTNCGGIGVQMLDANSNFLKESKRGFPTPKDSLLRLSFLNRLFPKSAYFNGYYLGHLNKDENHKVDVLAGAFIWIKKSIVDEVNGLDEQFFMYGEDIDFSYRIQQAGYDNYYLGTISILHYKGESTDTYSFKYIERFYGAMKIFSKKHYPYSYPLYHLGINTLIILHGVFNYFRRLLLKKG